MSRPKSLANILVPALLSCAPGLARADCAPPADGPPMCLVGTITSPGYVAALVRLVDDPVLETLRPNGQWRDWRVLKIQPRSILLGQKDREVTLALDDRPDAPQASGVAEAAPEPSESIAARSMRLRLIRKQSRQRP